MSASILSGLAKMFPWWSHAALCASVAALILLGIRPGHRALPWLMGIGPAAGVLAATHRYLGAWPMLPMHLAPTLSATLLSLALLIRLVRFRRQEPTLPELRVCRAALALLVGCLAAILFFPRDFYLPFPRTDSPFAHLMLWAGACGRVSFVFGTAWSLVFFRADEAQRGPCLKRALVWMIWGFALWTMAMFSGELWSYLGWGTAVVWEDPALLLMMAAWFLAIAVLHLHFSRALGMRLRAACAAGCGLGVLVLGLLADFGPFRPLW